jgi:cell division protein FtsQ
MTDTSTPTTELAPSAPAAEVTVVHPRVWQRRVAVLRERGRRRLRWIVAAVVVVVAVGVTVVALHTPLLALRSATVVGADHTTAAVVLQAAGLAGHPPLIDINPTAAAARIETLPWVAHATVSRQWPDGVRVTVTERTALGWLGAPDHQVALVDATGRVLEWDPSAPAGLVALAAPETPGLPGTHVGGAARAAVRVAAALPPSLAGRVAQVVVSSTDRVTLVLGGRLWATLGAADHVGAKLTALTSVLAASPPRGPALVDVSVPDEPTVGPPPPGAH